MRIEESLSLFTFVSNHGEYICVNKETMKRWARTRKNATIAYALSFHFEISLLISDSA